MPTATELQTKASAILNLADNVPQLNTAYFSYYCPGSNNLNVNHIVFYYTEVKNGKVSPGIWYHDDFGTGESFSAQLLDGSILVMISDQYIDWNAEPYASRNPDHSMVMDTGISKLYLWKVNKASDIEINIY